ncbi:hypothetical protein IKG20_01330 [Candidatus Saccharibacteria bacterium]|nr:hypothetical protein [Candidatus Saccharibacteria bacterium]
MKQAKSIIWGVAILALGVLFGGKALGLFTFDIFFDGWWTLFLIVPSIIGIITEKNKFGSFTMLGIGVVMLLAAQNVFSWGVAWKVILAVVLIMAGFAIIFGSIFHRKVNEEVEAEVKKMKKDGKEDAQVAVFSGNDRVYNKEKFTGSEIVAVFGGAELDISNAIIEKDVAVKAFCLFGGIDITVPKDIQIKTKSGFIFGGISDDRKDTQEKAKHTLYIDAAGGFGGVDIKDRASKKK